MLTPLSCQFGTPFALQNDLADWTSCDLQSVVIAIGEQQYEVNDSYMSLRRNGGCSGSTTIQTISRDTPLFINDLGGEKSHLGNRLIPEGVRFKFRIGIIAIYTEEKHSLIFEIQQFDFLRMETAAYVDLADAEIAAHCGAFFKDCQKGHPISFSLVVHTPESK